MIVRDLESAIDFLLKKVSGPLRLGAPLGLGKPNLLLNRIFDRIAADPARELEIFTALSLDPPSGDSFFEKRFYGAFLQRHFGDYPRLKYLRQLPPNIRVHEFYFQAGQALTSPAAQCNYVSLNYTHAARGLLGRGMNCVVQLVARRGGKFSLSCNPDLTLDVKTLDPSIPVIGVVHPDLPFLGGDAEVEEGFFDLIVDDGEAPPLFALPRMPVDPVSHLIGLHASQLVADGGTLQIGIGALSDALVHFTLLRQSDNALYRGVCEAFWRPPGPSAELGPFREGLYGTSEMVMDGFMHLREAGILKRKVSDKKGERYLQGAFFLGSKRFYEWLRRLEGEEFSGLAMTRVSEVNDLYGPDETRLRHQRRLARFFNTTMKMTLLGGAISETLSDGDVVSGVGGQYNFVAMSHELPDSLSVLMLKSTRTEKGRRHSNIVWEGGNLTIPRHLRDIVITEYGIAYLKGRTDEECIRALLEITDAQFLGELTARAKKAGKLSPSYMPSAAARQNTPARVRAFTNSFGCFPAYPFGSDFTPEEERIAKALGFLRKQKPLALLRLLARPANRQLFAAELERMELRHPRGWKARGYARLLKNALAATSIR